MFMLDNTSDVTSIFYTAQCQISLSRLQSFRKLQQCAQHLLEWFEIKTFARLEIKRHPWKSNFSVIRNSLLNSIPHIHMKSASISYILFSQPSSSLTFYLPSSSTMNNLTVTLFLLYTKFCKANSDGGCAVPQEKFMIHCTRCDPLSWEKSSRRHPAHFGFVCVSLWWNYHTIWST